MRRARINLWGVPACQPIPITPLAGVVRDTNFRRLIDQTTGKPAADIITPRLNTWKKRCETDAQSKAIDAIIQHAKTKGSCGNLPEAP